MTTETRFSQFNSRHIVPNTALETYLKDSLRSEMEDVITALRAETGVLGTPQTLGFTAPERISVTANTKKYLAGSKLLFTSAGSMHGCTAMAFLDDGASVYHVGLKYGEIPYAVAQGTIPGLYDYTIWENAIGELDTPDSVSYNAGTNTLTFVFDNVVEGAWITAGIGRDVVVWLAAPASPVAATAIVSGIATLNVGTGSVEFAVAHSMGQGATPSVVAADYRVFVKGARITKLVDLRLDPTYCYLGAYDANAGTFSYADQIVLQSDTLNIEQLAKDLYWDDPAWSLDGDGAANCTDSTRKLAYREEMHRQAMLVDGPGAGSGGPVGRRAGIYLGDYDDHAGFVFGIPAYLAGVVTTVLDRADLGFEEYIYTRGMICTGKDATNWLNYQFTPPATGYYVVYFYPTEVMTSSGVKENRAVIHTTIVPGAASSDDAMYTTLQAGYLPIAGYLHTLGVGIADVQTWDLNTCRGLFDAGHGQAQYEERTELWPHMSGFSDPAHAIHLDYSLFQVHFNVAAEQYYIPIHLPKNYRLKSVTLMGQAGAGGGGTSTLRAKLYAAIDGDIVAYGAIEWVVADGQCEKTLTPTAPYEITDTAGNIVYVIVKENVHDAGGADSFISSMKIDYFRCEA